MIQELMNSIETGDHKPIGYINPKKYIQHNLGVEDGIEGFSKIMSQLPKGSAKAKVVRILSDGDYVMTHADYNFFGPKVGFDIFRFEDGKIVEHWDNLAEKSIQPNPSGRTQLDGPTEIQNISKTEANKTLVQDFLNTVIVKQQFEKAPQYIDADSYHQHNPQVGDHLSGLQKALGEMAKQGIHMVYNKIHKVLGEGNFVLSMSEGEFGGKWVAYYDLFRIDHDKIVEHWDVIENIPPKEKWANKNGKF